LDTNVIYIDFRRKPRAAHVPVPEEHLPEEHPPPSRCIQLLACSAHLGYLAASSVRFALVCWLASLALLLARWR
jgi:hypothetical protein